MKFILIMGLPGSGKSSFATEITRGGQYLLLSSDVIREQLFRCKFDDETKELITLELISRAKECLSMGNNVVIDSTVFNESTPRAKMLDRLSVGNDTLQKIAIVVVTDAGICIRRDSLRVENRRVGGDVIKLQMERFVMASLAEGWDRVHVVNGQSDDKIEIDGLVASSV